MIAFSRFFVLAPAALLGLSLMLPATARASLANGGFDGGATGWTVYPIAADNLWSATLGNPGGTQRLNSNGAGFRDPYVEQTVTGLTPGVTYLLGWDLLPDFARSFGIPTFGVFLDPVMQEGGAAGSNPNGTILSLYSFNQLFPWASFDLTFMATSTSHTIRFAGELDQRTSGVSADTDDSFYIDNVFLVAQGGGPASPVPEPTTWALVGLGVVAAALRRPVRRG